LGAAGVGPPRAGPPCRRTRNAPRGCRAPRSGTPRRSCLGNPSRRPRRARVRVSGRRSRPRSTGSRPPSWWFPTRSVSRSGIGSILVKVARFATPDDAPRFGVVDGEELVVLASDPLFAGFETTGERVPLASARLLAPVIPRSKVVCVGLNYADHRADMSNNVDAPENPLIFLK